MVEFHIISVMFTFCEHPLNERSNEAVEAEMTPVTVASKETMTATMVMVGVDGTAR